jgi:hypothetical protein
MHRIAICFVAALVAVFAGRDAAAAPRPNIIFIDSDDVGLGDIHFTGGHFSTPNIDKLAAGGTHFT